MPTYVYEYLSGKRKGETFEIVQSMKDPALEVCPTTGAKVKRVLTPPILLGEHSDHSQKQFMNDKSRLGQSGMTKYQKNKDGNYEKIVGKGPKTIWRNTD